VDARDFRWLDSTPIGAYNDQNEFWRIELRHRNILLIAIGVVTLVQLSCGTMVADKAKETKKCGHLASTDIYGMDFDSVTPDELRLDRANAKSFQLIGSKKDPENRFARFTLNKGDLLKGGTRSEMVIIEDKNSKHRDAYYSWRMRLEKGYPAINRWQLFAQWHDQPDKKHGMTWSTKPETFPPISLRCQNLNLYLQVNKPHVNKWFTGPMVPIQPDQWVNVFFHIHWSQKKDGFIEAWVNDQPLTPSNGTDHKFYTPTLYNSTGNFLKIGNYRHNLIEGSTSIDVDDIHIGTRCLPSEMGLIPVEQRPNESVNNTNLALIEHPLRVTVAKWPDNRAGAISITYDGWAMGDAERAARQILKDRGLRISYEMVTATYDKHPEMGSFLLKKLVPAGFGYFGHGHTHIKYDAVPYEEALKSFTTCYQEMKRMGLNPIAYAYPYGAGRKERTQRALKNSGFLSGRLHDANDSTFPYITPDEQLVPPKWFGLPCLVMQDIHAKGDSRACNKHTELLPYLKYAQERKAWLILTYHAVGEPESYGFYPLEEFRKDADSISKANLYEGTMNEITAYMYERNQAKLAFTKLSENRFELVLSDHLVNSRFHVPLTLIIQWPDQMLGKWFRFSKNGKLLMNGWCDNTPSQVTVMPDEKPFQLELSTAMPIPDPTSKGMK